MVGSFETWRARNVQGVASIQTKYLQTVQERRYALQLLRGMQRPDLGFATPTHPIRFSYSYLRSNRLKLRSVRHNPCRRGFLLAILAKTKRPADTICQRLESDGIKCWIAPRDIQPGSDWTKAIMQGIEGCQVLILVFSEHANGSDHVYREVAKAFSSRLAVVPFRIEATSPTSGLSY